LYVNLDIGVDKGDMVRFITEFPFWLEGCTALTRLTVEIPVASWIFHSNNGGDLRRTAIVKGMMRRFNEKIGVQGEYVETVDGTWSETADIWKWEAGHRQTMNWAQDFGRLWRQPRLIRGYWESAWSFPDADGRLEERDGMFLIEDECSFEEGSW